MKVQPKDVVIEYLATTTADASRPPRCIIICGPPASGKTRHRRSKYPSGYALVDAAAIFISLAPDEILDFPSALQPELEATGQALASAAVHTQIDIVTEVIGGSKALMKELIDSLISVGYKVNVEYVQADVTQALQWNRMRSENNISAYYAEESNIRWLIRAAQAERQARS